MTNMLTTQDKAAIIASHQKNISYNQYNIQINLIEENAKSNPNQDVINSYTLQLADMQKQLDALDAEIASLPKDN